MEESQIPDFQMAPREKEELESFQKVSVPTVASAPQDEEDSLGYVRPVKTKEMEEVEEQTLFIPKAKVGLQWWLMLLCLSMLLKFTHNMAFIESKISL